MDFTIMRKNFEDLKVGDTVYILIQETVIEKTVTDIDHEMSPPANYNIEVEADYYPYFIPRDKDYALVDKEFIFANKEALVKALECKVKILSSYIERYS